MSILNERIKERRLALGITLFEVANFLGVKEATAQRYESGDIKNIKHETIVCLAELFNCSPAYLMGWSKNIYDVLELSEEERAHIQKYRFIDDKGKHTVDTILEMEYNRCKNLHLIPNAAHDNGATEEERKHADDIMDNDELWK